MLLNVRRQNHPRLFFPIDDLNGTFSLPTDSHRSQILSNIIDDCRHYGRRRPWKKIPERLDSPHPYHQLYITFYSAMQATAFIEHYAFAWKITGQETWLVRAKRWLLAAAEWEHSDRIEEHFYTANRYMHAFAFALDILWEKLTDRERQQVTDCLLHIMLRWWPDVDRQRSSSAGGHHAVVDNAHFGVAALHLIDKYSDAPKWIEAVVERFRSGIMPNGCGPNGEPVDGASFWTWENLWLLQFVDALRNVTGINLYDEFPERMTRPLIWFRYQLVGRDAQGAGMRDAWSPTLLRLAQDAGDAPLRNVSLADPNLGRIYRFMAGVKGSSAECMIAYGPYAYLFCDPTFCSNRKGQKQFSVSRLFHARYGDAAILRDNWSENALIAQVCGYDGGVAHNFSELQLHFGSHPVLKSISSSEAQPVSCGSTPCVGGQNEIVAKLGQLERTNSYDRLASCSKRLQQEFWLLREPCPVLLLAAKRRARGIQRIQSRGENFVRLNGKDYLQYSREPYFNPDAGTVSLRVRLRTQAVGNNHTRVLFNTGLGIGTVGGPGPQVNNYTLGLDDKGLFFRVQSQRGHSVEVRPPEGAAAIKSGTWFDVKASWGGFNKRGGQPFITVEIDGVENCCAHPEKFGELELDSQQLRSRSAPRDFYIKSNTVLAIGGAVQLEGTETRCDIESLQLSCPGQNQLHINFADGLGDESGSASLIWKLNPVKVRAVNNRRTRFAAGSQTVEVIPVFPRGVSCKKEIVPFAPSGLAAGSLRNLRPGAEEDATRILFSAQREDILVLVMAPNQNKVRAFQNNDGFVLQNCGQQLRFSFASSPSRLLNLELP